MPKDKLSGPAFKPQENAACGVYGPPENLFSGFVPPNNVEQPAYGPPVLPDVQAAQGFIIPGGGIGAPAPDGVPPQNGSTDTPKEDDA